MRSTGELEAVNLLLQFCNTATVLVATFSTASKHKIA